LIFKELTFSIAGKMGVYKNTTYFSDDIDDFLPIGFIRKSSNTIKIITKKIWYNVEKKSNRVEIVSFKAFSFRFKAFRFRFDAIRFDFDAIRFDFGAIRFAAKALRFPFVGPRLQRDHRRNLREGFAFHLGAISCRYATRRITQMKQISQIFFVFVFVFVNLSVQSE
jgi:hypothetical protein